MFGRSQQKKTREQYLSYLRAGWDYRDQWNLGEGTLSQLLGKPSLENLGNKHLR